MILSLLDLTAKPAGRAFFTVAREVYRGDRQYCAPFPQTVRASLQRPEFQGRQRVLVALEDGRPVARAVARVAPALKDEDGRPYGLVGFFEALERPQAVARLFAEALDWLRAEGAGEIVGPMDGDTWHSYRLNVGPWEEPPFLMEPWNPPYYPALWRASGFEVLETYCSKAITDLGAAAAHLEPAHARALAAGYRLEPLRPERFEAELARLYRLSCQIFRGNFLYSEIPEARFLALYRGARRLLDPDLALFGVAPDGSDAGFLFAFPDRFQAVAAMRGRKGPLALLRYLALRRRAAAVNFKSLGVTPEHRRSGLASALIYRGYQAALTKGYPRANHCLMLVANPSMLLDGGLGGVFRRYELYRWAGSKGEVLA